MASIIENLYVGDGATVLYSFTFPYIEETDVKVSLDGVITTAYSLANATTVEFVTAPANGVAIRIYRDTSVDEPKAVFYPGSAIRAQDLNDNFEQNLFVVQEADFNNEQSAANSAAALATAQAADTKADQANVQSAAAEASAAQAQTDATQAAADAATAQADATQAATDASAAQISADEANAAVQAAAVFAPVANVAAIPSSPTDQARVSVLDSTGIESFTPLTGLPVGPTYDSGVYVNLVYQITGASWKFVTYGPNDPDARYLFDTADSVSTSNITNNAVTTDKLADGAITASNYTYPGGIDQTVQARLEQYVSVKDFGAVCDGVTDDTAAIHAAIASGSGTVYLPPGTYNANIVLTQDNIDLVGSGKATILTALTGDVLTIKSITSGKGSKVGNFQISGTGGATRGVVIEGFSRGLLENLYINEIGTGIYIDGDKSTELSLFNIYCYNVSDYGIRYERTDTVDTGGIYIDKFWHTGLNTGIGMSFNSTASSRTRAFAFVDNAVIDNRAGYAVYINNSTNFWFNQCWITGTAPNKGLFHFENSKQCQMQSTFVQNSDAAGFNFYINGPCEDINAVNLRLSGSGTDFQFGGSANISTRCFVGVSSNTSPTRTNNESLFTLLTHYADTFLSSGIESFPTISGGILTVSSSRSLFTGEGNTTDNLSTINGGDTGDLLYLTANYSGYTVTLKHAVGNLRLADGVDAAMNGPNQTISFLKRSNGDWLELSRSNNP